MLGGEREYVNRREKGIRSGQINRSNKILTEPFRNFRVGMIRSVRLRMLTLVLAGDEINSQNGRRGIYKLK